MILTATGIAAQLHILRRASVRTRAEIARHAEMRLLRLEAIERGDEPTPTELTRLAEAYAHPPGCSSWASSSGGRGNVSPSAGR